MATTASPPGDEQQTEQPSADEPTETAEDRAKAEPFLASFNRADVKLLVMTFAGTLAANLVTVLVVALAIAVVRTTPPGEHSWAAVAVAATGALYSGGQLITDVTVRRRGLHGRAWLTLGWHAFFFLLCTLLLLGIAAGVK